MLLHGYDEMLVKQIIANAKQEGRSAPVAESMWASHLESLAKERQAEYAKKLTKSIAKSSYAVREFINANANRALRDIKNMAERIRRYLCVEACYPTEKSSRRAREGLEACHG